MMSAGIFKFKPSDVIVVFVQVFWNLTKYLYSSPSDFHFIQHEEHEKNIVLNLKDSTDGLTDADLDYR